MFRGLSVIEGNIGQAPSITHLEGNERSKGELRPLLKFTVKYDRLVNGSNNEGLVDKGGYWVSIDYWKKDGPHLAKLLQKGMRLLIIGEPRCEPWTNDQSVMEPGHSMTAESISILPRRIAAITLEEKAPYQQEPQSHAQSPSYMPAANQASQNPDQWPDDKGAV